MNNNKKLLFAPKKNLCESVLNGTDYQHSQKCENILNATGFQHNKKQDDNMKTYLL